MYIDGEYEVWNTDSEGEDSDDLPEEFVADEPDTHCNNKYKALLQWLLIFILGFQAFHHLTDHAIEGLFKFLKVFLGVLGSLCSTCAEIGRAFPSTLSKTRKLLGCVNLSMSLVSVAIHSLTDCIEKVGSRQAAKPCPCVPFGKHSRCNAILLKTVELASKKTVFYPLMTYCYIDIHTSLQTLLHRSQFLEKCQEWKEREVPKGVLADIYDGRVWKKFKGDGFFDDDYSFGFMLNCDWFQPYKHLTYSVGVIYLTVLNLPYSLRNKIHNVCLVGILPGPHEPSRDMNSFLGPLIKDLTKFWEGVELNVRSNIK